MSGSSRVLRSACSSTTINYITHRLPQQCLRTDRAASALTVPATASPSSSEHTIGTTSGSTTQSSAPETVVAPSATSTSSSPSTSDGSSHSSSSDSSSYVESPQPPNASDSASDKATAEDIDFDSPLDNAKFLSFEEWKKQNLAAQAEKNQNPSHRRDPQDPGFENALESMNEDNQLDLDIKGFGGVGSSPIEKIAPKSSTNAESGKSEERKAPPASKLPKDAGKTHSDRKNYALLDYGARVVNKNPGCKSETSILKENKDSYMLNECSFDNKFFIVELCSLVLVDTIVLANYEFFSSIFRTFRVSISKQYPVRMDKWVTLGTYEARNSREVQAFLVENPAWGRWIRVELLTHHGNEFYCPVSLIRVHGVDEREDLENDKNPDYAEVEAPKESAVEPAEDVNMIIRDLQASGQESAALIQPELPVDAAGKRSHQCFTCEQPYNILMRMDTHRKLTCPAPSPTYSSTTASSLSASRITSASTVVTKKITATSPIPSSISSTKKHSSKTSTSRPHSTTYVKSSSQTSSVHLSSNTISTTTPLSVMTTPSTTSTINTSSSTTVSSSAHSMSSNQPTSEDSFFKATNKRLQSLESNAGLSLQYIESQSRLLRDAFNSVAARNLNKTSSFLATLNATVFAELTTFRSQYDQIWQSTVLELASQKEEREREITLLGLRMELLAAELGKQRRIGIAQTILLIMCLALVLFSRSNNGTELRLAQNIQGLVREHSGRIASRKYWDSPWISPKRSQPDGTRENTPNGGGRDHLKPWKPGDQRQWNTEPRDMVPRISADEDVFDGITNSPERPKSAPAADQLRPRTPLTPTTPGEAILRPHFEEPTGFTSPSEPGSPRSIPSVDSVGLSEG